MTDLYPGDGEEYTKTDDNVQATPSPVFYKIMFAGKGWQGRWECAAQRIYEILINAVELFGWTLRLATSGTNWEIRRWLEQ